MMLPDLSDLWDLCALLESTSSLPSAPGCPGEPQGQVSGRVSFLSLLSPVLPPLLSVCLCCSVVSPSPQGSIGQWCRGIDLCSCQQRDRGPRGDGYPDALTTASQRFHATSCSQAWSHLPAEAAGNQPGGGEECHSSLCPWLHRRLAVSWFGPQHDRPFPVCPSTGSTFYLEDGPSSQVSWIRWRTMRRRRLRVPKTEHSRWNGEAPRAGRKPSTLQTGAPWAAVPDWTVFALSSPNWHQFWMLLNGWLFFPPCLFFFLPWPWGL